MRENSQTIGVRDAARKLSVTIKYVYDLLYMGKLPGQKIGRQWRIPVSSVEARLKK
jgi:excisionase family DNA binding protein